MTLSPRSSLTSGSTLVALDQRHAGDEHRDAEVREQHAPLAARLRAECARAGRRVRVAQRPDAPARRSSRRSTPRATGRARSAATTAPCRPGAEGQRAARPTTSATPSAQRSRVHRSGSRVDFQRASGPMPIRNTSGAISGTNTASKYGGPTEILPRPSASRNSGYSVPSSTDAARDCQQHVVGSSTDSRETEVELARRGRPSAHATRTSASEPPMTSTRKPRMNTPRAGSVAKACTEVSTPERTRKVPSRLTARTRRSPAARSSS